MKTKVSFFLLVVSAVLAVCVRGLCSTPIVHWRFDEDQGTTAYDSVGDNDGTLVNGPSWTVGHFLSALEFDGVNDYVRVPDDSSLDINGEITISAWIRLNSIPTSYTGIVSKAGFSSNMPYSLQFKPNKGTVYLCFFDGSFFNSGGESRVLSEGMWYHVVGTYDNNYIRIYINAQLDSSQPYLGTYITDNQPLLIGRQKNENGRYFPGTIDDVLIYDKALTGEEVRQLFERANTIAVEVDIKPGSCPNPLNLDSRGVLPVAVLGADDFDVSQIDIATVRLTGVDAVRSSLEDVSSPVVDGNDCECGETDPDGFMDLTLKFKIEEIVEALIKIGGELEKGEVWELDLTGQLLDGTPIEDSDCVTLVGNVSKALAARKTDINEDGIVNMVDIAVMSQFWLEPVY